VSYTAVSMGLNWRVCGEAGLRLPRKAACSKRKARFSLQRFFAKQLRATKYFASRLLVCAALRSPASAMRSQTAENWGCGLVRCRNVSIPAFQACAMCLGPIAPAGSFFDAFNHSWPNFYGWTDRSCSTIAA